MLKLLPFCCGEASPKVSQPLPQGSYAQPGYGHGYAGKMEDMGASPTTRVPLTGRKRSLLVGINYFGSENELHGCVADVHRMLDLLNRFGFPEDERSRRVLVDSPQWPRHLRPTLQNMREGIAWLVADAQPGDCLLFHYSGHGGRMPRNDGAPSDYHETLCPVDMETEGMLLDSELFQTLVRPLPAGCRLTCILDSCHSGGVLDLPFLFVGTQENLASALAGEAAQMVMTRNWLADWQTWQEDKDPGMLLSDVAGMGMDLWGLYNRYNAGGGGDANGFRTDEAENRGAAAAEVLAFTGCASEQTSADVGDVNQQFQLQPVGDASAGGHLLLESTTRAGGALTSAFVEAMQNGPLKGDNMSFVELLEHLRQQLSEKGFSQVPQLASSLILDLHEPFSMDTTLPPPSGAAGKGMNGTAQARSIQGGDYGSSYQGNQGGGFGDMLMGMANGFMTAEAIEEAVDLVEEAGDMLFDDDGADDW